MQVLAGCGSTRDKRIAPPGCPREWRNLVTLDINDRHKPDIVHDLNTHPLPFETSSVEELHFYEVLEHLGRQGDYLGWFSDFSEYWRVLKPDGYIMGTSPARFSPWAWGDPGHTRLVSPEAMTFLIQPEYSAQVGVTAMTDYRFCYQADFQPLLLAVKGEQFVFMLQAIKPSRIT